MYIQNAEKKHFNILSHVFLQFLLGRNLKNLCQYFPNVILSLKNKFEIFFKGAYSPGCRDSILTLI